MELSSISNGNGANRRKRRVGSGEGNGHGKTCGRGQKGSKSRSGYSVRPGFEGGQMPLYLKLPHRGFNNHKHRINYGVLNVRDLAKFDESETIDLAYLIGKGFFKKSVRRVKLLSVGEVDKAYKVVADKASPAAIEKVQKAGGSVELPKEPEESAEETN